jgi:hypothetical protein
MRLPPKPLLEHVFKSLAKKDDEFVASVLEKALELQIPFEFDELKTIRPFVTNERGVEVFRHWMRLPCIRDFLAGQPRVVVSIRRARFSWRTLAHALAQNDRGQLLDALLGAFPVYRDCKVQYIPLRRLVS